MTSAMKLQHVIGSLDTLIGDVAVGWAAFASGRAVAIEIEIVAGGEVIGCGTTSVHRPDVAAAGLMPVAGFYATIGAGLLGSGREATARVAGGGVALSGSVRLDAPAWSPKPRHAALFRPLASSVSGSGAIDIVLWLGSHADTQATIASVRRQTSGDWRLILIGDRAVVPADVAAHPRILVLGASGAFRTDWSAMLDHITARYLLFVQAGVELETAAVALFGEAATGGGDIVYADELLRDDRGVIVEAHLLPAFSHDFFIARPYFGACFLVSLETARAVQVDEGVGAVHHHDFLLRLLERAGRADHVPVPLHRTVRRARPVASACAAAAHLARIGRPGLVTNEAGADTLRIEAPDPGGRVLVIIPTKNGTSLLRSCITALRRTTSEKDVHLLVVDHESDEPDTLDYLHNIRASVQVERYEGPFNFSRINNVAVARARTPYEFVLMLNNDVEAIRPGWLEHMRALAARPDVGVVGATLLYGNGAIQHGGVILGMFGIADHSHKHRLLKANGKRIPSYLDSMAATRDYSAVTGACMMMRAAVYRGVGGLDEELPVDYNDVDFCLRIGSLGLKILLDVEAVLFHHESVTRAHDGHPPTIEAAATIIERRWQQLFDDGDPFYHPGLSLDQLDHVLDETGPVGPVRVRSRRLWPAISDYALAKVEAIERRIVRSALPPNG